MSFVDSYKSLEKLCSEMYGDNHGLSAYIDEMIKKSNGSYYVSGWNEDLKQLKHYRWVRNQIVREPGCTEDNMCEPGDAQWINNFYLRIMSVNDPLALYRKAITPKTVQKPKQTSYTYPQQSVHNKKKSQVSVGCLNFLICALIIAVAVALIFNSFMGH